MGRRFSKEQANEIRERVILEAGTQFGAHGFKRVTIEDIASASGIAKGTVYRFFVSKEALCAASIAHVRDTIQSAIVNAILFDHAYTPERVMRSILLSTHTLLDRYPVLRCVNEPELLPLLGPLVDILTLYDTERIMLHWREQGMIVDIAPRTLDALLLDLAGISPAVVHAYAVETGSNGGTVKGLLLSILDVGLSSFIRKDRKGERSSHG